MNKSSFFGLLFGSVSILIGVYIFVRSSDNFTYLLDFVVIGIFLILVPAGMRDILYRSRIKAIENRLPDFLRDVAEAAKFGTNLADSIKAASEGQYGVLTPEIKKIAAQIRWGVTVDEALSQFVSRNRTPFIEKLISTVIESNISGGNVSEVLSMIAYNSKESQVLEREKYSQMKSYIIIIVLAYAVFILTVLILDLRFFPQMSSYLPSSSSSALSYLNISSIPVIKDILAAVVIIQGIGSGLMSGVLEDGRYQSGLVYAGILTLVGYSAVLFLGGV